VAKAAKRATDKVVNCILDMVIDSKDEGFGSLKVFFLSTLLSNQCFPNPITIVFNECRFRGMVGCWAVVTRNSRICTVK
jgi:hypothetical protein